jgi:Holliday junction resolvasome RuvABC endonuclease subunit
VRVLGIDPDLHHAGVALVDNGKTIVAVRCPCVSANFRGSESVVQMSGAMFLVLEELFQSYGQPDVCVVESQESYLGSNVRPQDLIHLGQAAGAAVGIVRACWGKTRIEVPKPKVWKGTIPKDMHQKRILRSVGIPFEIGTKPTKILRLPEIDGFAGIKKSNLIHVVDAIGLACWGSTL